MTMLRVTTINDQLAIVLPPEMVAHLNASDGDELEVEVRPSGRVLILANPVIESQVRVMNEVMDRRTEVLRRLAE